MDLKHMAPLLALALTACSQSEIPTADDAIAAQPGPRGTVWHLTDVRATDDALLVSFQVRGPRGQRTSAWLDVDGIHLIDDTASVRYGLLDGVDGEALASSAKGDNLQISVESDADTPVWMKFPLPPAGSRTVSITLPRVGTFDGVAIER